MYMVKRTGSRHNPENTCKEVAIKRPSAGEGGAISIGGSNFFWEYVYIGPWPIHADAISKTPQEWLLCIGGSPGEASRKMFTLFSSKFVVYDRYNKWIPGEVPASQTASPALPLHAESKHGELELDVVTLK